MNSNETMPTPMAASNDVSKPIKKVNTPAKSKNPSVDVKASPSAKASKVGQAPIAQHPSARRSRPSFVSKLFSRGLTNTIISHGGDDQGADLEDDIDDVADDSDIAGDSDIDSIQHEDNSGNHNHSTTAHHNQISNAEKALFSSTTKELASNRNTAQKKTASPMTKRNADIEKTGYQGDSKSRSWDVDISGILFKVVNILFPLFFIVLAVLHIVKVGRPQFDAFALCVEAANKVAVTLWPIMFAAVATQSLRAYAIFQAERGITLMTLEQLLHSTSFSSALKQPLMLRKVDLISIFLFVLWGISPLASQALLRISILVPGSTSVPTNISYTETSDYTLQFSGFMQGMTNQYNAIYAAALISPKSVMHSPRDSWGNPKVPQIGNMGNWATPPDSENIPWSSLIGIPLSGVPMDDHVDVLVNQNYLSFDCPPFKTIHPSDFPQYGITSDNDIYQDNRTYYKSYQDIAQWNGSGGNPPNGTTTGDMLWAFRNGDDWQATSNDTAQFVVTNCTWNSVNLVAHIACDGTGDASTCVVDQANLTNNAAPKLVMDQFMRFTVGAIPLLASNEYGPPPILGQYLLNPDQVLNTTYFMSNSNGSLDMLRVSPTDFSLRMSSLFNAFWMTITANRAIVEGTTFATSNLNPWMHAQGTSVNTANVYATDLTWLVIFFICDAFILLFAIADIIFEARTISPNFLGFASSVVRSNQHLRKEFAGKIDGHERARAMADMKVMIQDVNAVGERGKIALAPSAGAVRLRKDRQYT